MTNKVTFKVSEVRISTYIFRRHNSNHKILSQPQSNIINVCSLICTSVWCWYHARSYNSISKKTISFQYRNYTLLHTLNWDHPYIGLQAKQGDRGRYWEQVSYFRAFIQDEILHKWKAIFTKGRRSLLLAQKTQKNLGVHICSNNWRKPSTKS